MTISNEHDALVPSEPETIGELLARHRQRRRMTQAELAEDLGVAERTVRSWESGQRAPRGKTVHQALERVLGQRLIPVGEGRYRTAPGQSPVPNLSGVDIVETTTAEGRFVISFPKGLLDGLTPLERELRIARAQVAALEAIQQSGRPEGDESHMP